MVRGLLYLFAPSILLAAEDEVGEDEDRRSCLPVQGLVTLAWAHVGEVWGEGGRWEVGEGDGRGWG